MEIQLLNVCGAKNIRQTEIHIVELLVSEPTSLKLRLLFKSWEGILCLIKHHAMKMYGGL